MNQDLNLSHTPLFVAHPLSIKSSKQQPEGICAARKIREGICAARKLQEAICAAKIK